MAREYSMDRRAYLATVGAGTTAGLAGCIGSITGGGKTVIGGTAPGFPPFEMEQNGKLVGFDIDLLEAVVKASDYSFKEWKTFEFGQLIQALNSEKIDTIAAAMTITDKRDKTIDFSDPYYSANQSIIVRENGDFQPSKLGDLSGHPVGAQAGTTGESVIQEQLIKKDKLKKENYNAYDNYVLAVEDLQNGNIDAVVVDEPVGATFAEERPVKVAFVYETGEQYGFGLRTDDNDRTKALNSGLATVKENGTYDDLKKKWFASD